MEIPIWAYPITTWFTPTILFCFFNLAILYIFIASKFIKHELGDPNLPLLARVPPLLAQVPPLILARVPILARVKSINFSLYKFDNSYAFQPEIQPSPQDQSHSNNNNNSNNLVNNRVRKHLNHPSHCNNNNNNSDNIVDDRVRRDPNHPSCSSSNNSDNLVDNRVGRDPNHPSHNNNKNSDNLVDNRREPDVSSITQKHNQNTDYGGHVSIIRAVTCDVPVVKRLLAKLKRSVSEKAVGTNWPEEEEEEEEEVELRRPATVREREVEEDEGVDAKADDFIDMFKKQLKLQRLDSLLRYRDMLGRGC